MINLESKNAFLESRNFKKQNMQIIVDILTTKMLLHGNIIAIKNNETNKIKIQNCGWFSKTTKERLNALPGVSIQQKNFNWYLNGVQWNGNLIEIK